LSVGGAARAGLEPDGGAGAAGEEFFRCPEFLEAEGTTHTLTIEWGASRVAIPLLVRGIEAAPGALDASSPYSYPGGEVSGEPIDPDEVDWSGTGLVSIFIRDRIGEPRALRGGTDRSIVLVSDPRLPRKSRMSDRQQIRRNQADGYEIGRLPGPETTDGQRLAFHRVYTETMVAVDADQRYMFELPYFDLLFRSPRSTLFWVAGPDGDVAAAAIVVISDGFVHYYLSGTAESHRRRAPSKNLIAAVIDHAEQRGLPMNLGGGVEPGDGLEEFKRGFANAELPFRTHEVICDPSRYAQLSAGREDLGFFPLYRGADPPPSSSGGGVSG
jgi:hypothetical protein